MKSAFFTLASLLSGAFLMIGADFMSPAFSADATPVKKNCVGYVVLEAGKGLDCNGDTLKLVKRHGYYEPERTDDALADDMIASD